MWENLHMDLVFVGCVKFWVYTVPAFSSNWHLPIFLADEKRIWLACVSHVSFLGLGWRPVCRATKSVSVGHRFSYIDRELSGLNLDRDSVISNRLFMILPSLRTNAGILCEHRSRTLSKIPFIHSSKFNVVGTPSLNCIRRSHIEHFVLKLRVFHGTFYK